MSSIGKVTAEAIDVEEDIIPDSTPAVDLGKTNPKVATQPASTAASSDAPAKVSVRDMISKVNAKATVPPSGVVPSTGTRSKPTSRATTPTNEPDAKSSAATGAGAGATAVGDRPQPTSSPTALARKQPVPDASPAAGSSAKGANTSPSGKRPVSGRQLSPEKIAPFMKAGTVPTPASSTKTTTTTTSSTSALPKLSANDVKPAQESATASNKDAKSAASSTKDAKPASTGYSFPGFSSLLRAASGSSRSVAPASTSTKTTPSPATSTASASTAPASVTSSAKPEVKTEVKTETKTAETKPSETKPTADAAKAEQVAASTAKVEEAIYDSKRTPSTVGSKVSELAGKFASSASSATAQPSRSLSRPKRAEETISTPPTASAAPSASSAPATPTVVSEKPVVKAAVEPVKSGTLPWAKKTETAPTPAAATPAAASSSSAAPVSTSTTTASSTTAAAAAAAVKPVAKVSTPSWMKKEETPAPTPAASTAKPAAEKEPAGEAGEKKMSIADRMKAMGGASMIPFGVKAPSAKPAPFAVAATPIIPTSMDGGLRDSLLEKYASKLDEPPKDGELRHKTSSRASIRLGARRQPTKRNMSVDEEEARAFSLIEDSDGLEADIAAAREMMSEDDV